MPLRQVRRHKLIGICVLSLRDLALAGNLWIRFKSIGLRTEQLIEVSRQYETREGLCLRIQSELPCYQWTARLESFLAIWRQSVSTVV